MADPSDFQTQLSAALLTHQYALVHLYATNDPKTGESWCGDCRRAHPVMDQLAARHTGVWLDCPVGNREEYKKSAYRDMLQLSAVPTLYLMSAKGIVKKWVEAECYAPSILEEVYIS